MEKQKGKFYKLNQFLSASLQSYDSIDIDLRQNRYKISEQGQLELFSALENCTELIHFSICFGENQIKTKCSNIKILTLKFGYNFNDLNISKFYSALTGCTHLYQLQLEIGTFNQQDIGSLRNALAGSYRNMEQKINFQKQVNQ
ncbi:hypothetical protein ABPG74_012235 [Tetrahymena malaccensis]